MAEHNKSLPAGSDPISIAYFFDHFAGDEDTEVVVVEDDFEAAKRELVPSVSKDELWHYERVRRAFEGATIGAKDAAKTKEESVGQNKKESVESGDVPSKKLANADTHHTPTPPPPTTLHVPKTTQQQPVEPRGSWMKQAKDRIKRRSTSRGRGGGVGHGGGHGGGIAQAAGKGKGRTEFGQRSQASSDSPESVYRMPSAGSVGTDGAVEDRKEEKEDDDDEYVIKTEHLKSNGSAVGSGKGKGKGKWKAQGAFGDAAGEDDEMYA